MEHNMEYRQAREYLLGKISTIERLERVPLAQAAGRVLAEPVYATGDVPPFDRSPFDGYAFQAADTQNAEAQPVTLRILEEVPAGSMWKQAVTPGTATKILTGAPVPPGADAVTKYEDTVFNSKTVTISKIFAPGDNVVPQGEDVKKGQQLAVIGTVIDSALLGTLAAQGITAPLVYGIPKVGIITTGSELVEPGVTLSGGKIVNTNQYTFRAAVAQAGCEAVFLGTPGDDPEAIGLAFSKGIGPCDLLISTGGVSVGDYDFTPDAMERAGAEIAIRTLKLKPGGASAYGFYGKTLLCGLSGNPASALTNFYAVVLPVLRRLRGLAEPHLTEIPVVLGEDFSKKSPKTRLIRGILDLTTGQNIMHVSHAQGNGVLHSLIGCDLLAEIPAGSPRLSAGTKLTAYLIP